jgi:hypothetical protein
MKNYPQNIITMKIKKRDRYNKILEVLREPHTVEQLESILSSNPHSMKTFINNLRLQGYIKVVGVVINQSRAYIWQAVKFEYSEEGVDYNQPAMDFVEVTDSTASLADAHYVHNPNAYAAKMIETSRQTRAERKSPRVYVSGAQTYA